MIRLLLPALLLALAGCATTNQFTVAEYEQNTEQKFPPVSLYFQVPQADFRRQCEEFDTQSVLNHCSLDGVGLEKIHSELQLSSMFESAYLGDDDIDYQLLISTAVYNREGGDDLGSAALAGAAMLLLPISVSAQIKVDAVLTWNGQPIRRYEYEIPFTTKTSLLTLDQDAERDMAKGIVSRLISDFQSEEIFAPQILSRALRSSDYFSELTMPEEVGEFVRDGIYVYRHPLQGVQVRYLHKQFQFDYIDVFVYPIPGWRWQEQLDVLANESFRVRKDMELVEKQGYWSDLSLGSDRKDIWNLNGREVAVLSFLGEFADTDLQKYQTHTYLFIRSDKFIKVRASFAVLESEQKGLEHFARNLLANIVVPEESLFMAKVRKQWRDKAPNY